MFQKNLKTTVSALALALLLTACSSDEAEMPGQGTAPPPPGTQTSADPTPAEILSTMDPTEGITFKPLFEQKLDDDEDRIARLESAVQSVRNDLDGVVIPSVMKLVAAERAELKSTRMPPREQEAPAPAPQPYVPAPALKIPPQHAPQEHTAAPAPQLAEAPAVEAEAPVPVPAPAQAQPFTQAPEAPAPAAPQAVVTSISPATAPVAAAPVPTPAAAAPATAASEANVYVKAVRIGDHPDMTRLVIDVSSAEKRDISLAHEGTQLVVDLGSATWTAKPSWQAETAMLVASWKYIDGKFYADLLGPATIKKQMILPSADTKGMYRIVIDLYSKGIHK